MLVCTYNRRSCEQTSVCRYSVMAFHVVDISRSVDEPVGVLAADEFEEARRDPKVMTTLEQADRYLAELERQGRSR